MISKKRLLKYLDEHISNYGLCMTDIALDRCLPDNFRKVTVEEIDGKRKELQEIKKRLEKLLF